MSETQTAANEGRLLATVKKNSREEVRVVRKVFEGHDLVDARVWALSAVPDTPPTPTKKGLCASPEVWEQVASAVLAEIANEAPVENPQEGNTDDEVDDGDPLAGDV